MLIILVLFAALGAELGGNCGERAKASQRQRDAGQHNEHAD